MTKRGSNEIASYLLDYFTEVDERKVEEVDLFRDGCAGQNRNSVLPSGIEIIKICPVSMQRYHGIQENRCQFSQLTGYNATLQTLKFYQSQLSWKERSPFISPSRQPMGQLHIYMYICPDFTKAKMYRLHQMHIEIYKPPNDMYGQCTNFTIAQGCQKEELREAY